MRLDACKGDTNWTVWHVTEARQPWCVWVDDETAQWGECQVSVGCVLLVVNQEKRIAIYPDQRLVLINPVADSEPEKITIAEGIAA